MSALPDPRRPSWWPEDFDEWPRDRQEELLAATQALLPPLRLRYTPFVPTPKQRAFLLRDEIEAFYGGAAGPGKSTALLMAALQYCDVPGYSALLLRRTYQELALPGALMPKASEWLSGTGATWKGVEHTWTFPSLATLTFGYLQHSDDKYRYKGSEFSFIGFDELTEFDEDDFEYLFSRLRKPYSAAPSLTDGVTLNEIPLRMRSASNPGGPGHDWVQDRYVNPQTRAPDRVYVPALLTENPYLDREAYAANLMRLRGAERERLLRGDWGVIDQGDVFNVDLLREVEDWASPVAIVRYWDLAATEPHEGNKDPDYTTGARLELGSDGVITITDVKHVRLRPGAVERFVQDTAVEDGYHVRVFIEQDPGQAGKAQVHNYARLMPGVIVQPGLTKNQDKRTRALPAAAAIENGVLVINRWLRNLRTVKLEMRRFRGDKQQSGHDDIVDAITGGYTSLTQAGVQSHTSVSTVATAPTAAPAGPGAPVTARTPLSVAEMMAARVNRRG